MTDLDRVEQWVSASVGDFPSWRDITERQIPEHGQRCIVWHDGHPDMGRYVEHLNRFYVGAGVAVQTRWWMPAPSGPVAKMPGKCLRMSRDEQQTDMFAG